MAGSRRPWWTSWTALAPVVAVIFLALVWGRDPGPVLVVVIAVSP